MNWETTSIRPQQGDKIIALKNNDMIIGVILIEPLLVKNDIETWRTTTATIVQDDDTEIPLDDFYLWTPYPEGGSRDTA